jgi:hypothetical protein
MIGRRAGPSVAGMDDEPRRHWRPPIKTVLVAVAVVAVLLLTRRPGTYIPNVDLPDVSLPDLPLPDLPDWLGPVLKWGKLVVLVTIGALAVLGELERRRRRDRPGDSEDVRNGEA